MTAIRAAALLALTGDSVAVAAPPAPATDPARPPVQDHVAALWPHLTRPALGDTPGSALALPEPYVVSGRRMLETYDVEQARPGGGGEYPLQDGFGWSNGAVRALIARYGNAQ